mgnify:CR=1 FL=1
MPNYRTYSVTATAAGTPAGSALGTAYTREALIGRLHAVHFDYSGTATTTDVALQFVNYPGTIISRANSVTDGWFYPSVALSDGTAVARTAYGPVPVADQLALVIAQGSAGDTVTATMVVEF